MKITIFGANGKVGSLAVDRALELGFEVVGFVHGEVEIPDNEKLTYIRGDVHDKTDVLEALRDSEAVVSCLGSWGTPTKDILSAGMANIIPAMEEHGIQRIVSLTGAAAYAPEDGHSFSMAASRIMLQIIDNKVLHDGEQHIQLLAESHLDWTVLRSPPMTNSGVASDYQLTTKPPAPWKTINRESVAYAMLELVASSNFTKAAPFIERI